MSKIVSFLCLFAYALLISWSVWAQNYTLVTGYLPPWSMAASEPYPGSFVEIVKEAARRVDGHDNHEIKIYPWGRAQTLAREQANVFIFPVARLAERETSYQWVAPIKKMEMTFVRTNGNALSVQDAKKLGRILVHRSAPPEMVLKEAGFENLVPIHDVPPNVIRMIEIGRVDAWFAPKDMAYWVWKFAPERAKEPVFGETLSRHDLYLAASPKMPAEIVKRFSAAIGEMKADGTLAKILEKYGAPALKG